MTLIVILPPPLGGRRVSEATSIEVERQARYVGFVSRHDYDCLVGQRRPIVVIAVLVVGLGFGIWDNCGYKDDSVLWFRG